MTLVRYFYIFYRVLDFSSGIQLRYFRSIWFFWGLLFFFRATPGIWKFPGWESTQSCSCQPTPQPQQCGIWAMSQPTSWPKVMPDPLIYWARPGIEPTSSWILVGFATAEPQWELLSILILGDNWARTRTWGTLMAEVHFHELWPSSAVHNTVHCCLEGWPSFVPQSTPPRNAQTWAAVHPWPAFTGQSSAMPEPQRGHLL